jgi:hypothetical protein
MEENGPVNIETRERAETNGTQSIHQLQQNPLIRDELRQ